MSSSFAGMALNKPLAPSWRLASGVTPTRILWVLLALTLVRGLLYAVLDPLPGAPDERDHFQYVQYLAGDKADRGVEGHQPVPYYALMVPAYRLAAGHSQALQLLAIRLASLPFLLGIVLFTWLAARKMAPNKPFVSVVATAFVALHPQLAYIGASANNDNAANFMGAVLTYLVVLLLSGPRNRWAMPAMVLAIGAATMTKGQILPLILVSGGVLVGYAITRALSSRAWQMILYPFGAAAVALLAFLTDDGNEGITMMSRSQGYLSVLARWPEAVEIAQGVGLGPFAYQLVSFWSAFLGESIQLALPWYVGLSLVVILAPVGYVARIVTSLCGGAPIRLRSMLLRCILASTVVLQWLAMYTLHLQIRLADPTYDWIQQTVQGRYLFVFLVPLSLLVAEGWTLLAGRHLVLATTVALIALFVAFDFTSLFTLANHYSWTMAR